MDFNLFGIEFCDYFFPPPLQTLMDRRIRPWINKKIIEYIGEEEATLVDFVCSKVIIYSVRVLYYSVLNSKVLVWPPKLDLVYSSSCVLQMSICFFKHSSVFLSGV